MEVKKPEIKVSFYDKGKNDAISTNRGKSYYDIIELRQKTESSRPNMYDRVNPNMFENIPQKSRKEYRLGYIEGLKELENRRE